ncbi:SLC13 family permease [Rhodoplanes sp. TEM]|uniref:SLC13 family permease n=1 Tax=Rhodoplanes tepidamans TaxID=200616 RepID=A0ABT5JD60_RHOTP|nr:MULTISPECIES: SLC13 family permease [Rhodoplanes]MDC7787635.1 SLC13 family permease [Rhodoplanes tepidamans]MDC7984549.1 SLC13 family permease [Rhodoplanes sp. TEM]MDQ0355204.1 di/tricarboxylate transporter [Rhodoplanes tepidamans]
MTLPQGLAFAIVGTMMVLFVWGRLRYDLVAALALIAAVVAGIVPPEKAFTGFGDDVVIIVASALLVSAAVAKSGVMEEVVRPLGPWLTTPRRQVFALVLAVIVLSTFIKNVGALAILMPVAFQLAKRTGTPPSWLLMPLASGSLIGGLITLVGTSPNVIVARLRADIVGEPFGMFDYAPVGIAVAAVGLVYLAFAYRLLPKDRHGGASMDAAINIENYVVEAEVPKDSPLVGKRVTEVGELDEGVSKVTTVVRDEVRRQRAHAGLRMKEGDILLIEGEPDSLERAVVRAGLQLAGQRDGEEPAVEGDVDEVGTVEAVVTARSALIAETHESAFLCDRFGLNLIAISRSGERVTQRLRTVRFRPGDVVVLQGRLERLPDALKELGLLPLAERDLELGRGRRRWIPVAVLAATVTVIVTGLLPVAVAFFAAAVALVLTKTLALREVYEAIDWPIVVLLGALIPVSEAVQTTGGTDLIAGWLSVATDVLPAIGALALILVVAMVVTPFLNNAATVLVMAPIAASLAGRLGLSPDPFLMAVAVGAACDFLTPFGHQSNTLVMGPGGYRFGDYARLGLPLSLLVIAVAVPAIAFVWPMAK